MKAFYTIGLLVVANVFMTAAWYTHIKMQQSGLIKHWPLFLVIVFSWGIAFFEYCLMIPANRIGIQSNGGPFTLIQLKVIQEVITLLVFTILVTIFFQNESFRWNHFAAFLCLIAAVYFCFMK
jgi:uncharacterized protein (DUF486 family)